MLGFVRALPGHLLHALRAPARGAPGVLGSLVWALCVVQVHTLQLLVDHPCCSVLIQERSLQLLIDHQPSLVGPLLCRSATFRPS